MVVFDTSVVIDHIRQPQGSRSLLKETIQNQPLEVFAISMITIQELFQGKSSALSEERNILLDAISSFELLPYTFAVAQTAGELSRDLQRNMQFADAAIAASALINRAKLVTLNKKDFQGIGGLELL